MTGVEDRVRRYRLPTPGRDLRERIVGSALATPPAVADVWDRTWYSRAARFGTVALLAALLAVSGYERARVCERLEAAGLLLQPEQPEPLRTVDPFHSDALRSDRR